MVNKEITSISELDINDLLEYVKQMRHSQRRYKRNPKPEILKTLEYWERKVDNIVSLYSDSQLKLWE